MLKPKNNLYLIILFNTKSGHVIPKGIVPDEKWALKIMFDLNNYFHYDKTTTWVFRLQVIPNFYGYTLDEEDKITDDYNPHASDIYLHIIESEKYKSQEDEKNNLD